MWNYFYHDIESCDDDHVFDPYNVLKIDDEIVFPVHITSIFGYSDKISLLTFPDDDILYDYQVNVRFKQNITPDTLTPQLNPIQKYIVGEPEN